MRIDKDKQKEAQDKAQKLIALGEQKRAEKRLQKLTQELEQGNGKALYNNEFVENLPYLIKTYCQADNHEQVNVLFENLGKVACGEDLELRERAVMTLSLCLDEMECNEQPAICELVITHLLRWLEFETNYFSVFANVCKQLQKNGTMKLEEGMWEESIHTLELFRKIQSGELEKSNAIRGVVGRALEAMAADHILEELTPICIRGRGSRRENAERCLLLLGRKAANHLLDRLISSQEKDDRLRLMEMIPDTGYAAVPVLKEYLQKDLPWYGIRNIILMAAASEDKEFLPLVLPYLEHEDLRVQQQVIEFIHAVEKDQPGEYLFSALTKVNDQLKGSIIGFLGQSREPGSMEVFLDLLGRRDTFSDNARDNLLKSLAIQVRLSDSIRAVNLLTMILKEREEEHDPETDPVALVVSQSLQILEPRLAAEEVPEPGQAEKTESSVTDVGDTLEEPTFDGDPLSKNIAKRNVQRVNEEVAKLLGQGRIDDASQLLYEKCIETAMNKDFVSAEMFRDRILEVDPNALPQLIRAGERIEEERASAVPQNHITLWQDLYDSLSTEEFNALYQILESESYSSGSVIVEQGTSSPVLYFLNSGQARLTCGNSDEEIFLKKVKPGEIVGVGPFFDVSVWTVSLAAISKTDVHILQRDNFIELAKKFPAIDSCIRKHCLKNDTVRELLEMSGKDRRRSARYPVSAAGNHTLLEPYGDEENRSFTGEIVDLSTGGCSFIIQISSQENGRLLLGKDIQTQFTDHGEGQATCKGQIVAVRRRNYENNMYSIHVQFSEPISDNVVKSIADTK